MAVAGGAHGLGDAQRKLRVGVIDGCLPQRIRFRAGKTKLQLQRCGREPDGPQCYGTRLPDGFVDGPKGTSVQRTYGGHILVVPAAG